MSPEKYRLLKKAVIKAGYEDDIRWSIEDILPPLNPEIFAREVIFVICNSGMKAQVAEGIFKRFKPSRATAYRILFFGGGAVVYLYVLNDLMREFLFCVAIGIIAAEFSANFYFRRRS